MAILQLFGTTDQVTVRNPTNKDFVFSWDKKNIGVRAGGTRTLPGYLAEQYVKDFTNLMMQQDGKRENILMDTARRPYYDKLVVSVDHLDIADAEADGDADFGDKVAAPTSPLAAAEAAKAANKRGKNGKFSKRDDVETLSDAAIDQEFDDDALANLPTEEELMEKDKLRIAEEKKAAGIEDDDEEAFATK